MPDSLPVPIIRSKLYPPPLAPDTLTRERLMALAPEIAGTTATLISAPAGYGKSTLASHWLSHCAVRSVWISLDPGDCDLQRFMSYIVAAFRNVAPDCCSETASCLVGASLPSGDELAGIFSNDFEALDTPVVLVLDDFHNITASDVHDFVDALLRRPPKGLHIVIITRRDPPLSLHELRARGVLTEIRMRHLAFNGNETAEFISGKFSENIADPVFAKLFDRTEGWPAGLRLAALAFAQTDRSEAIVNDLPDSAQVIQEYLLREVLASCPDRIRELLFRTAFLNRFCGSLCDAMAEVGDNASTLASGAEFVQWINDAGLFVIALDGKGVWYRYHHLFQSMLIQAATPYLGEALIRKLHLHAAAWMEAEGSIEEAIEYLLAADAGSDAGQLIVRNRHAILDNEQWHLLEILLASLPDGVAQDNAELLMLAALSQDNRGLFEESWQTLDRLDDLLRTIPTDESVSDELRGSIDTLRAFQHFVFSDGEKAIELARHALERLPKYAKLRRGTAVMMLAAGMQITGRGSEVPRAVLDLSENAPGPQQVRSFVGLAFSQWMDGNLAGLGSTAELLSQVARDSELPESRDVAAYFSACIAYETNDLAEVKSILRATLESNAIRNGELFVQCQCLAALAYLELGEQARVGDCLQAIDRYAKRMQSIEITLFADALAAEIAYRNGRYAEALAWAGKVDVGDLTPHYNFFQPSLTRMKILVAGNDDRATKMLNELLDYMERTHNERYLAEALALQALLFEQEGQHGKATHDLARAVAIAQPGRFIRLFVDLGPGLGRLLSRLDVDEAGLDYIGEILAAFGQSDNEPAGSTFAAGAATLGVEPLSPRELQILTLLAERLSNKEIAEKLHISTVTVKRHAANIYQKLGVHGRRQAVAKANGLGIFSRPA